MCSTCPSVSACVRDLLAAEFFVCRCSLRSVDDLLRIFAEYISIFDYWREIYCFIVHMCISKTLILYFTNKLVTDE